MSSAPGFRKVWDLPTRLFHWFVVVLVALLWVSGEFGGLDVSMSLPGGEGVYWSNMDVHELAGQAVFVLITFRLLWGIWGSTTARFGHFIKGPSAVIAEAAELASGKVGQTTGHNPVGGLMVVVLILLLGGQSITGMLSADDLFYEGPLTHLVSGETIELATGLHHRIFGILQILVILHIAAVFYYLLRKQNLIKAMITGSKHLQTAEVLRFSPIWLALLSLVVAIGALVVLRSL